MEKISSFVLPNDLTVIHAPKPTSLSVSVSLMAIAGCLYESPEEIGAAHFLEHLVFCGTEKYPDEMELAKLIDERGGIRNAYTNKETVEYFAKVLKDDAETAFEYLSEISIRPLLRSEDVEKQKKVIEQEIYRFKSDPEKLAPRLIYSLLYPGTRAGIFTTGEIDDIQKISREKILTYHKRAYCGANMVLTICGNISKQLAEDLSKKYFLDLNQGKKIDSVDINAELPQKTSLTLTIPNLKQTVLTLGQRGLKDDDPGHYAADLISVLLTRGKSSRLFHEIRERRSLAYMITGNNLSGRNIGIFTLQVGLAASRVQECIEVIKAETKRIISEKISDRELAKILSFIKSGIAFSFEDSLTEASYHSRSWCSNGRIETASEVISHYESVIKNPGLIQETAKRLFNQDPSVLLIGQEVGNLTDSHRNL